jgi:hypothetical protein
MLIAATGRCYRFNKTSVSDRRGPPSVLVHGECVRGGSHRIRAGLMTDSAAAGLKRLFDLRFLVLRIDALAGARAAVPSTDERAISYRRRERALATQSRRSTTSS